MKIDLKKLRKDKGLSQKDVGEMFGTGQTNISMLENGNRDLTEEQKKILINIFGENEIAKYKIHTSESSNENQSPSMVEMWEMVKQQTTIISSQQDVIKAQQNTIDFLSKKGNIAMNAHDVNAG